MDEMEFTEAESNMNDLVSEYQQYQEVKRKSAIPPSSILCEYILGNCIFFSAREQTNIHIITYTQIKYFLTFCTCCFNFWWRRSKITFFPFWLFRRNHNHIEYFRPPLTSTRTSRTTRSRIWSRRPPPPPTPRTSCPSPRTVCPLVPLEKILELSFGLTP